MNGKKRKIITPSNIPFIGISFALIYWLADSLIDVYLYNISLSFYESVLFPNALQLWMRGFVLLLFMLFSVYVKRMLEQQELLEDRMQHYEERFEYLVDDLRMEMSERKQAILELEELSSIDSLTTAYNRRKLHEVLRQEIDRKYRFDTDLSIVMIDIDSFKKINDDYGHHAGDNVLIKLTDIIKNNIREADVFARWSGGEFVILMPDTTIEKANSLAEALKQVVITTDFDDVGKISVSFGASLFDSGSDTADTFVNRSDDALIEAKEQRSNEVNSD